MPPDREHLQGNRLTDRRATAVVFWRRAGGFIRKEGGCESSGYSGLMRTG